MMNVVRLKSYRYTHVQTDAESLAEDLHDHCEGNLEEEIENLNDERVSLTFTKVAPAPRDSQAADGGFYFQIRSRPRWKKPEEPEEPQTLAAYLAARKKAQSLAAHRGWEARHNEESEPRRDRKAWEAAHWTARVLVTADLVVILDHETGSGSGHHLVYECLENL